MENLCVETFKNKVVHFVGIGGISMSALAVMMKKRGAIVQGSDVQKNAETEKLLKQNICVFEGHDAKNLKGVFAVCFSSAIHDDNPEILEAKKQGLLILKRAELLACLLREFENVVAVSGSHGKTTTTAMIAEMFVRLNLKPTLHIGGIDKLVGSNFLIGENKYAVVEACEYKDNFLMFYPDIAVILNIDADHLDYFGSIEKVKDSFFRFSKNTNKNGLNIVCFDDENSKELLKLDNVLSFGFDKRADVCAVNVKKCEFGCFSFDILFFGNLLGNIKLNIAGKHNILNALASVCVAFACLIDFEDVKFAVENFVGVERRCEKVAEVNGAMVYHDYAHHPNQIKKMVEVGRLFAKEKGGRVFVVFEPHTYSRTKFLFEEFVESFVGADVCFFAPAYSARELECEGVEADVLAAKVKEKINQTWFVERYEDIVLRIKQMAKCGDVVLVLGAGNVEKLAKMF